MYAEKSWNVSLLGTRKTGKTVYLGGLYQYYGDTENLVNDTPFYIYAPDSYSRGRLAAYADGISENPPDFPDGTLGIDPFPVEFNLETDYGAGTISRILSLIDHEGAALTGSGDRDTAERYDEVVDQLKSYDAFIGFLSCEHLLKDSFARDADWETMRSIIRDVARQLGRSDKLPVTIVLAKYDLAEALGREEEVMEKAVNAVTKLSESVQNASFMICPVNVVRTDGNGGWEQDARPTNIAAPFLFASSGVVIRNALFFAQEAKRERAKSNQETRAIEQRKQEMTGFWGFFKRIVQNTGSRINRVMHDNRAKRAIRFAEGDMEFAQIAFETLLETADRRGIRFIYKGNLLSSNQFSREIMTIQGIYA